MLLLRPFASLVSLTRAALKEESDEEAEESGERSPIQSLLSLPLFSLFP